MTSFDDSHSFSPFSSFQLVYFPFFIIVIKSIYILIVTYKAAEIHRVPALRRWSKDSSYLFLCQDTTLPQLAQ